MSALTHGTQTAYCHHGCRCRPCRDAVAKHQNLYLMRRAANHGRPLTIAALGATRRIQALHRLGWRRRDLDILLGHPPGYLAPLMAGRRTRVTLTTHAGIDALYRRLSMTDGGSHRTRSIAVRRRWAPPLAWDDDTIDNPNGRPTGLRRQHVSP